MADDSLDRINAESEPEKFSSGVKAANDSTKSLSTSANAFSRAISGAFAQGIVGAKSFDTVVKSLALRISSLSLNLALRPITNAFAGGLNQLFTGLTGAFAGTDRSGILTHNDAGQATGYAKGGVIASPTYFPLAGNSTGLAGEAGPEAIMPLTRGADGRLGVASAGGGAANVTVNIATPDADSFRRSDTYLTGLIARAVARGQRGL